MFCLLLFLSKELLRMQISKHALSISFILDLARYEGQAVLQQQF